MNRVLNKVLTIAVLLSFTVGLGACSSMSRDERIMTGTLIGAGVGAGVGAVSGGTVALLSE